MFYGTFTPQNYTAGTANQSFSVKFSYLNWAYMASCAGAKAVARNSTNWSSVSVSNWTSASFKAGTLSTTQTVKLTSSISVATLSSNYASYGQTISISGGNYVYAESPVTGGTTWSTGWKSQPHSTQLKVSSLTTPRSSATARSSFWDSSNYGGSWYAQKAFNLQYTPSVSNY